MSFLGRALPFLLLAFAAGCSTQTTDEAAVASESNLDEADTAPADGPLKPDATFGTNGSVALAGPSAALSVAKRADGSIAVLRRGGALTIIEADGSAQADVALASEIEGSVHAHKDGLVVVGATPIDATHARYFVSRVNAEGAIDATFTPDPLDLAASASAVTKDGKIIVAGSFGEHAAMVRLDANGSLDPSFGDQGLWLAADDRAKITKIALGADESIYALMAGADKNLVAHFSASGRPDSKFGAEGVSSLPSGSGALLMTKSGLQYIGPNSDNEAHAFEIDAKGAVTEGDKVAGAIIGFGATGLVSAVTDGDACTVHVTEKATTSLTADECSTASYVALGGGKRALVINGAEGALVRVFAN